MLKALELIGFKSFADKTRFEFDAGMTAVVGPNGSGKSNVVDALRWILGEQSAKSLRGKEMADVIFNGCTTRRSLGMAEVSLTLDNQRGYLSIDSEEVVLTRRVYRSGEGEYLINGRVARLRDIKDLFLGTGAGLGAYSIIEQGKVEMMLQASTKDRRQIFEEAAGISRYRVRKIECLRRLDRVEQNLLRVRDIHEEVEKQLRALRSQAGKARKFREYSDRLRELRLGLGLADYRRQSAAIHSAEEERRSLRRRLEDAHGAIELAQRRQSEVDESLARAEEAERFRSRRAADARERLRATEAEIAAEASRLDDLSRGLDEGRAHVAEGGRKLAALSGQLAELRRQQDAERAEHQRIAEALARDEAELEAEALALADAANRLAAARRRVDEAVREIARLEHEQAALESHSGMLWQQRERAAQRETDGRRRALAEARAWMNLLEPLQSVQRAYERCRATATRLHSEHKRLLEVRHEKQRESAALRNERAAVESRIEVLESLRQRHEGLQGGVRQALLRKERGESPWQSVLGVLAESISVPAEMADLVELALGSRAQALIVSTTDQITPELVEAAHALPGRVLFLPLEDPAADRLVVFAEESPVEALVASIECPPELRPLVDRLLGNAYVAHDFQTARMLLRAGIGTRFVTRAGDLVESDGSISAGPHRTTAGILSRAAELKELQGKLLELDASLSAMDEVVLEMDAKVAEQEARLSASDVLAATLADQCRHFEMSRREHRRRHEEFDASSRDAAAERKRIEDELADVDRQVGATTARLERMHAEMKGLTDRSASFADEVARREQALQTIRAAAESGRLAIVKSQERAAALESRIAAVAGDLSDRRREVDDHRRRLADARARWDELDRRLLTLRAILAERYAEYDASAPAASEESRQLLALREERRRVGEAVRENRALLDEARDALHSLELKATEMRLQRDSLAGRILEDYGVRLEDLTLQADADPEAELYCGDADLEERRREIEELREKISRLGAVNLQAIEELDQLEQRTGSLEFQMNDLATAKRHLEEVIERINEESRRLFLDAFEAVRGHFQELFRQLFGGGRADILLEDDTDVLETGIEIIARPPGKEPRSISLLSGGEKTLTAVALLLALFRSKPSPFCILDEVDAALDEANIGRFVAALRAFLTDTQFIVVTHSKTTMAAADVLHGVTQRESGVSIRVSVRVEDVAEDGRIEEGPGTAASPAIEPEEPDL